PDERDEIVRLAGGEAVDVGDVKGDVRGGAALRRVPRDGDRALREVDSVDPLRLAPESERQAPGAAADVEHARARDAVLELPRDDHVQPLRAAIEPHFRIAVDLLVLLAEILAPLGLDQVADDLV